MWLTVLTAVVHTPASVVAIDKGLCVSYPAYFLSCASLPISVPVKPSNSTGMQQETVPGPRASREVNKQLYTFSHKTPEEQFWTLSQH